MRAQKFQCRTQHCVCWDHLFDDEPVKRGGGFNAARSIVCVGTVFVAFLRGKISFGFNAARSIVCVGTL